MTASGLKRLWAVAGIAAGCLSWSDLRASVATAADNPVHAFLNAAFSVTDDDVKRVDAGVVIVRTLPATAPSEVTTFGIVRIAVTPAFYVAHLHHIAEFKRDQAVLQVGVFSTPPAAQDIAQLTLDEADLGNLRECRIGRCGLQLPAATIQRLQREIDWRQTGATAEAEAVVRRALAAYAADYRIAGPSASMRYADGPVETDVEREFASMSPSAAIAWSGWAILRQHLMNYPASSEPPALDHLYWSKEKVRGRGVVTMTHLAIMHMPADGFVAYAIGSKQIYASHYYDASLGVTVLVPCGSGQSAGMYLIYLNQSRIDLFEGAFGAIVRNVVKGKARNVVGAQLARLQQRLEKEFGN